MHDFAAWNDDRCARARAPDQLQHGNRNLIGGSDSSLRITFGHQLARLGFIAPGAFGNICESPAPSSRFAYTPDKWRSP